jgi:hypothetical protein
MRLGAAGDKGTSQPRFYSAARGGRGARRGAQERRGSAYCGGGGWVERVDVRGGEGGSDVGSSRSNDGQRIGNGGEVRVSKS